MLGEEGLWLHGEDTPECWGEEGLCFCLVFEGSISWLQYGDSHPESPHILEGPISEGPQVPGSPCVPGLPPWGPWGWVCAVSSPCTAKGGSVSRGGSVPQNASVWQVVEPHSGRLW